MGRVGLALIDSLRDEQPVLAEILESFRTELHSMSNILTGEGSPEGVIAAKVATLYIRRDPKVGVRAIYVKNSGEGTDTGWRQMWMLNEVLEATPTEVTAPGVPENAGVDPDNPFISRETRIRHGNSLLRQAATLPNLNGGFTFSTTTSSVNWSWASLVIRPSAKNADGTAKTFNPPDSNQNTTGLSDATLYKFYPYWDILLESIQWVDGGVGTPDIAHVAALDSLAQLQAIDGRIPLSVGAIAATTGGGGGSGGGSGPECIREGTPVNIHGFGFQPIEKVRVGDLIPGRLGWVTVEKVIRSHFRECLRVYLSNGDFYDCSPNNPFSVDEGGIKKAKDLSVNDILLVHGRAVTVDSIGIVRNPGKFYHFACSPEHEFRIGEVGLLCHNIIWKT